jgi:uncharacterized SAM-binding protein YcdF (DUF218 family)
MSPASSSLAGFEDGWVTAGRGGLALNEAAERLTEGLLARLLPNAKVIFAGGVGYLFGGTEAGSSVYNYLASQHRIVSWTLTDPSTLAICV